MILLTPELRGQLLANGRRRDVDHMPVVKFFNPLGEGVWLATELDEDGDTLFGLADLGEPELGSFSLAEMTAVRLPLGLGIERDILFGVVSENGKNRTLSYPQPHAANSPRKGRLSMMPEKSLVLPATPVLR
ncbi:DUF2958 domain-containing protein [Filomicrobium sp.]|uniref:DUF2958 domain-containing protein n=1 Tax=Filomicrobium sp. TaxID=2024831 RepID=UPI0025866FF1|nr:DUF2958 domain-containing protein [Filomicrobium sp.]